MLIPLSIGLALALAVFIFASLSGFDRDRAFYPTVLIVVALYYVLFAVMSGSPHAIRVNVFVAALFAIIASIGFKRSSWLIVIGLAAHGLMDLVHGSMLPSDGVPPWWPAFCAAYDLAAAGFLAWTLRRSALLSKARVAPLP